MRLKGSVGQGGKNLSGDVMYVQILLTDWLLVNGRLALAIDGIVGPKTISAIKEFQRANTAMVDASIEPNRSTIKALERKHLENIAVNSYVPSQVTLAAGLVQFRPESGPSAPIADIVNFYLDKLRGEN